MQVHAAGGGAGYPGAGVNSEPRLIRAAHEFEGQMLKELLKPMTASDGLTGAESEEGSKRDSGRVCLGGFG